MPTCGEGGALIRLLGFSGLACETIPEGLGGIL
jgi:hypothetical protein